MSLKESPQNKFNLKLFKEGILILFLLCFSISRSYSQQYGYGKQCDTTFNGNDQVEYIICHYPSGELSSEVFFSYWPNERLKKKTVLLQGEEIIQLFDSFGNCIEYLHLYDFDHILEKKSWKYFYRDTVAYITLEYDGEGDITSFVRTYKNEPRINDHIEIFDTNMRIIRLEGARPLSAINPTEQIMLKYLYATENGHLEAIEFHNSGGNLLRRGVFVVDDAGELSVIEQKPNGKEVLRTKQAANFYIQEYRRATSLNTEMQTTVSIEIDDLDERKNQLKKVIDTTFNDKHLPLKIIVYKPNGKIRSTESIQYYPSDTVSERIITNEREKIHYKMDEEGDPNYILLEEALLDGKKATVFENYLENEYDSLDRNIMTHVYNAENRLEQVVLREFDESGVLTKSETLDSTYTLEKLGLYKRAQNGSEIVEIYNAQGYMTNATKELQLSFDSEPIEGYVEYEYNKYNELAQIVFIPLEAFFGSHTSRYKVYFTKKSATELFSVGVYRDNIQVEYIHKNDELLIFPLAQEFSYVVEQNAKMQKTIE